MVKRRVFFFKLKRERFEKNSLTSIPDEHDNELFAHEDIERVHVQFSQGEITCFHISETWRKHVYVLRKRAKFKCM